jgi:outer membrane protein OmpA-like peptidoglycan-associated protein
LTDSQVGFIPGTDTLSDVNAAQNAIAAIVKELNKNTQLKVKLDGYTARDTCKSENYTELSLDRANAIKNLFVKSGIGESRITTEGMGSRDFEGRNSGECVKGVFDTNAAQNNRVVFVNFIKGGN